MKNSFVKQFVAFVKGDDAQVQAEKAFRQSQSALKVQISSMEGDVVDLEQKVEDAKEALQSAKVAGGQPITDRTRYVDNLISAKNDVIIAEDTLESHNARLKFLRETLAELKA